jgi:hypothetical protein
MGATVRSRRIVVLCRRCHVPLTGPLDRLTDLSLISGADQSPFVPRGYFVASDGEFYARRNVVTNLGDRLRGRYHTDQRRLNGCCGPSGLDGMNWLCPEGHEVGTACSDCWVPHAMLFDRGSVLLRDGSRPLLIEPSWLLWNDGCVVKIARSVTRANAPSRLPILHDALVDAACDNEPILAHCREPGTHPHPCWVIALLLREARKARRAEVARRA